MMSKKPGLFRIQLGRCLASSLVAALLVGCWNSPDSDDLANAARPVVKLKALVIDDPLVGEAAQRRWQAEGFGELSVTYQTRDEFEAAGLAVPPDYDVLFYPERYQVDLVHRQALLEIPNEIWNSESLNKNDLLTHFRGSLLRQGDRYFALPLSGVPLMLVYRADCLAALQLSPPQTWDELEAVVVQLRAAGNLVDGNGQPLPTAIALPLGDEWAAHLVLARSAAMVRSVGKLSTVFQIERMEPLIANPPFQLALESLQRLAAAQFAGGTDALPHDVYRALVEGEAALGITWLVGGLEPEDAQAAKQLRVARLPGAPHWYEPARAEWVARSPDESWQVDYLGADLRVVSVLKNSLHAHRALQFVAWVSSKQISQSIGPGSLANGPSRLSHLSDPQRWVGELIEPQVADDYAQHILAIHQSKLILTFPRIVNQRDYLKALADAVRRALHSEESADQALGAAAAAWNQLNERIGLRVQRDFLRRGEGF